MIPKRDLKDSTSYIKFTWFIFIKLSDVESYAPNQTKRVEYIHRKLNKELSDKFAVNNLEKLTDSKFSTIVNDTNRQWTKMLPKDRERFDNCFYNLLKIQLENNIIVEEVTMSLQTYEDGYKLHIRFFVNASTDNIYQLECSMLLTDTKQIKMFKDIIVSKMNEHKTGKKVLKDQANLLSEK